MASWVLILLTAALVVLTGVLVVLAVWTIRRG